MSDKKIKHFVFSRFFPGQVKTYPYNVLATDFLKRQLPLTKNILSSLENQTNKNFELFFVVNPAFCDDPRYEFIFSTLQNFTTLPLKFIKRVDLPKLLQDALNEYEFVIASMMDFDDFVYKGAVAEVQNKVNECKEISTYGYGKGYIYSEGELYNFLPTSRAYLRDKTGYFSAFYSVILKSSFAKNLPSIILSCFNHVRINLSIKDFLNKNGIKFHEVAYQQNFSTSAIIYFVHRSSREQLLNHDKVGSKKPLTSPELTKKYVEEEFGFFHELKSIT